MFEVGLFYSWGGDTVTPYFTLSGDDNTSEYAEKGFFMNYNNKQVGYKKNIVRPAAGAKCECVKLEPLVFNVDSIESPLFEDNVKYKQLEVIKAAMKYLGCSCSELDVSQMAEISIPHHMRDLPITQDIVLKNISEYLTREIGSPYEGSYMGYSSHEDSIKSVLTILFGRVQAYAMMKLKDSGKLRIEINGNKITAYYEDEEFNTFLGKMKAIVGVQTSAADSMLDEIRNNIRQNAEKSDATDDVTLFCNWYSVLWEPAKQLFTAVNPDLAEATWLNNTTVIRSYGSSGLRQTMWLIWNNLPTGCDKEVYDFYVWMFKKVSSEGWNKLGLNYNELFCAICNRYGVVQDEVEKYREMCAEARKFLASYVNETEEYCGGNV